MSEFQDIQKLLRLKRFEMPSEDFVEDFVVRFSERQRAEMFRLSARDLLWERVTTYFNNLLIPKWTMSAAAAGMAMVALVGAANLVSPGPDASTQLALASNDVNQSLLATTPKLEVATPLISEIERERPSRYGSVLLSQHFENDGRLAADDLDSIGSYAGVSPELMPVSFMQER